MLFLGLAVLVAILAPVVTDRVPENARAAIESQFSEQLDFLRALATREPPGRCLEQSDGPPRFEDPRDEDWWRQAEARPDLFEDSAIVRAKVTCRDGIEQLGFAIVSRDRAFAWSKEMLVPQRKLPKVSLWHVRGKHLLKYQDRVVDQRGEVRTFELVVGLEDLDLEGPEDSADD